jgi:enoyl-CoA hydratase/carnithine racemase
MSRHVSLEEAAFHTEVRTTLQGDHFVVTGQNISTAWGRRSDWMFALVRTNRSRGRAMPASASYCSSCTAPAFGSGRSTRRGAQWPSSALAMRQPSLSLPARFSAGTTTLSKKTSLSSSSPATVFRDRQAAARRHGQKAFRREPLRHGGEKTGCVEPGEVMSEEHTVTYELDGEIALVGLNRPDKRNCFNPTVMKQLREAIERAGEEAKCGIIFGHGDNFCAGLDLRWAAQNWKTGRSQRLPFPFPRKTYFEEMARGNIPFIAALHGATLGGGLETAAAAHIRVADETTYFGLPEGTRGIFIGGGGSVRVARLIGFGRMQDMMLTGRVLKCDEAERYGIVQYLVPKGQHVARARELALKICKNAPLSNFAITNSLPRLQDMGYDDGLYFERMVAEYTRSPESIERLHQFLDKRAPRVRPDQA